MFCSNCGAQNQDGTQFCSACGAKMEEAVAVETVEETVEAVETAEAAEAAVEETVETVEAVEEAVEEAPLEDVYNEAAFFTEEAPKNKWVKFVIAGVVALAVIVAGIFGVSYLVNYVFGDPEDISKHPVVYVKEGEELMLRGYKAKESFTLTDEWNGAYSYYYQVSDNGKIAFFADEFDHSEYSFNLYYRKTNQETPKGDGADDKGIKIEKNVNDFEIMPDGSKVVYQKDDKLYFSNLKEAFSLGKDVDYFILLEETEEVLYLTEDEELMIVKLKKDAKAEKIDDDVYSVFSYPSEEDSSLYYVKIEDEGDSSYDDYYSYSGSTTYNVYLKEKGKDPKEVASDVSDYAMFDGTLFVTTKEDATRTFSDIFDDDCASSDAAMVEPEYDDFPMIDPDYGWETYDWDAYYEAWDEYSAKEYRDELRMEFEDGVEATVYSLHMVKDGEMQLIGEGFAGAAISYDRVLQKSAAGGGEKIKMSSIVDYSTYYDVYSELYYGSSDDGAGTYYILKKDGTLIEAGEDYLGDPFFSDDDKTFYCIEEDELVSYDISGSTLEKRNVICDEASYAWFADEEEKVMIIYLEEGLGIYDGKKYTEISSDEVGSVQMMGDSIYFLNDVDYEKEEGTLTVYKNGKAEEIADGVYDYILHGESVCYYLQDPNSSYECDLYGYYGKEPVKLDDDVTSFIY